MAVDPNKIKKKIKQQIIISATFVVMAGIFAAGFIATWNTIYVAGAIISFILALYILKRMKKRVADAIFDAIKETKNG